MYFFVTILETEMLRIKTPQCLGPVRVHCDQWYLQVGRDKCVTLGLI